MRKIDFIIAILVSNKLLTEGEAIALTDVVKEQSTNEAFTSLLAPFEIPHCCGDCDGECNGECHEKED